MYGILGYTHIRKDFGEKSGILFSFLTYFLPVMTAYAGEVRMYSWSFLFVTLTSIYAYRFYMCIKERTQEGKLKNLIIFGIFSICSCFVHYYGLVTTALINLILLIYLIRVRKTDKKALINFLILAVIQVVLYIPWLIYFVGQLNHVKGGFWITLDWVSSPVEILSFQFRRQLDTVFSFDTNTIISLVSAICMYIYLGFRVYKSKKAGIPLKPAILSIGVYIGVIFIMFVISQVMSQAVLFSRYLFVMTGLYIFGIAYLLNTEKSKVIICIVCTIIVILGTYANITNITMNYSKGNMEIYNYIKENIKEDDIIVYSNIGNGGVVAAYFPDNKQYFLNFAYWDVEEAYKAYGPGMETVYDYGFLDDYKGRIWLIDSEYMGLYEEFPKENINVLKEAKRIDTNYHEYIYNVMLLEKK